MMNKLERFAVKPTELDRYGGLFAESQITIDDKPIFHVITTDFPPTDPWSEVAFKKYLMKLKGQGWADRQAVLEIGIGDGRNEKYIADRITGVVAIDIEGWKLNVCAHNFANDPFMAGLPVEYYQGDGAEILRNWVLDRREKFSGRVLLCLPQSVGAGTSADVYEPNPYHKPFRRWQEYGLTLNAAVLAHLRGLVSDETEVLLVLSGRIQKEIREGMIEELGWLIEDSENIFRARVQQDPDTNLGWMRDLEDDGSRFFDKDDNLVSIEKAIGRVEASGGVREDLDLYHDVFVYRLKPNPAKEYHASKYGKERPNFARTTESWALPMFYGPHNEELSKLANIDVLGITSSGQILDWAALTELETPGKIRRLDLIDFNPCQNLYVAYILAHLPNFTDKEALSDHLKNSTKGDINNDWEMVFQRLPELRTYKEDGLVDWDNLNDFLVVHETNESMPASVRVPLDKVTTDNLRHYFFRHDGLYQALTKLVVQGKIHFNEGSLEEFQHPEGKKYHFIYSSDIHPWTDKDLLLVKYKEILDKDGFVLFPTFGGDCDEVHEFDLKDRGYLEAIEASGLYDIRLFLNPFDGSPIYELVRSVLGIADEDWVTFLLSGDNALPFKQKVPVLLRRKY